MRKNILVAMLIVFSISGCGILGTPVPTSTPIPSPTNTPAPPTATLVPSPTPDPLLFRDDFEDSIDGGWQWVREDSKTWSLTNNPGWLEIMARSGGVGDGNIKNLFLRQVPEGNFELETKMKFRPAGNFQIAGLLIYESAANFIQFGRAYCNSKPCVGDGFYIDSIAGGGFTGENFATEVFETDTVHLRLRREGSTYTAYASENGADWKVIGAHNNGMIPLFVGLVAGQSMGSASQPAQFDYFLINALP